MRIFQKGAERTVQILMGSPQLCCRISPTKPNEPNRDYSINNFVIIDLSNDVI